MEQISVIILYLRPTPTDAKYGVIRHFAVKEKVQPTPFFEHHFGVNGVGEQCHAIFGVALFIHAILLLPFFFFFLVLKIIKKKYKKEMKRIYLEYAFWY